MGKRIILLLDGTWNDSDFGAQDTNIVRIRDIIARALWAENDEKTQSEGASQQRDTGTVTSKSFAHQDNIVFYERGVGTGAFLNRFLGGALGKGLSRNIVVPTSFCRSIINQVIKSSSSDSRAAHSQLGPGRLSASAIELRARSINEVLARFLSIRDMAEEPLLLREVSSRIFWGLSKVLDGRGDVVAALPEHDKCPFPEQPIILNVHLCVRHHRSCLLKTT